jgi:MoxR-like ATPase
MSEYYVGAFGEGRNLTAESAHFVEPLFRDELATQIVQILARRRSVLLVGASGVGKTRVVHAVASRMRKHDARARTIVRSTVNRAGGTFGNLTITIGRYLYTWARCC